MGAFSGIPGKPERIAPDQLLVKRWLALDRRAINSPVISMRCYLQLLVFQPYCEQSEHMRISQ